MNAQTLLSRAIPLHQAGKLDEAAELYRQAIAADRDNFHAHYLLAALFYQQQRVADALAEVDTALAINPAAAEAVMLRGVLARAMGEHREAVARLEKAVALNPRYGEAWHNLGTALLDLERHGEAVTAFDKALALEPRNAEACCNRGLALQALDRNEEALASYRQALAIRPDFTAARYNVGVLLCNMRQQLNEALASFDSVLALEPGNAKAWTGRAVALSALQRFDEALAATDRALAIDPGHAPALSARGTILCESDRVGEAMEIFSRQAGLTQDEGEPPPHQVQHDGEQQGHLTARGIALPPGGRHVGDGARLAGPAVNPANVESATRTWETSTPQLVVIDNLLTEAALKKLRDFCWDSTMWRKPYPQGYLGAMPETGFAAPLLAQIADELRDMFPGIFAGQKLRYMWGFKYDSSLSGHQNSCRSGGGECQFLDHAR